MLFFLFFPATINAMLLPKSPVKAIPRLALTPIPRDVQEGHESYYFPQPAHYLSDPSYYEEDLHDTSSFEPAFDAAYDCNLIKLKSLVNQGNINRVNGKRESLLFSAIKGSFKNPKAPIEEVLEFLFDNGGSIDTLVQNHRMSGLEFATRLTAKNKERNFRTLAYFILAGADPFLQLPKKKCAFDVALGLELKNIPKKYPHAKAVLALFRNRAFTLEDAVISCNVDKVRELASPQAINVENKHFKKPLFTAITRFVQYNKNETLEIIEILLKNGAKPNEGIKHMTLPGNTNLIVATIISILRGDTSMILPLIQTGGNPFLSLIPGMTPSAFNIADVCATVDISEIPKDNVTKIEYSKDTAKSIVTFFEMWKKKDDKLQHLLHKAY